MKRAPLAVRVRRMVDVANLRLEDAEELGRNYVRASDSDYLLRLLAFEILLKALVRINNGSPKRSHSYQELFQSLPDDVRKRVLVLASERMSTSADYSNVSDLLATFSKNFVTLRYPYEAYELLSEQEYQAAGEDWATKGAPLSEAVFVYHPEELLGLTFALQN